MLITFINIIWSLNRLKYVRGPGRILHLWHINDILQNGPRAWQNSFNSIIKWLPRTCNQFGFQTKTSTTKF